MNIYEKMLSLFYKILKGDNRYKYYEELSANLNLSRIEVIKIQNKINKFSCFKIIYLFWRPKIWDVLRLGFVCFLIATFCGISSNLFAFSKLASVVVAFLMFFITPFSLKNLGSE